MPSSERTRQESTAWSAATTAAFVEPSANPSGYAGRTTFEIQRGTRSRGTSASRSSGKEDLGRSGDVDGETLGEDESDDSDDTFGSRKPRKSSTQALAEFLATTGPEDVRPRPRDRKVATTTKRNLFFRIGRGNKEKKSQQSANSNIPIAPSPVPPAGVIGVTTGGKKYVALQVPHAPSPIDFEDGAYGSSVRRERNFVSPPSSLGTTVTNSKTGQSRSNAELVRMAKLFAVQPKQGLTQSQFERPFPATEAKWETQDTSFRPSASVSTSSQETAPERPPSSLTIGSSSSSLPSINFPVPPSHSPSATAVSVGEGNASTGFPLEGGIAIQQASLQSANSQSYVVRSAVSKSIPVSVSTSSVTSSVSVVSSRSGRVGSLDRVIFNQLLTAAAEDDHVASTSNQATTAKVGATSERIRPVEAPILPGPLPARTTSLRPKGGECSVFNAVEEDGEDGNITLYHPEATTAGVSVSPSFQSDGTPDSVTSDEQRTKKSVTFVDADATLIHPLVSVSSLPKTGPGSSAAFEAASTDSNAQRNAVSGISAQELLSLSEPPEMDQESADRELAARLSAYRAKRQKSHTSAKVAAEWGYENTVLTAAKHLSSVDLKVIAANTIRNGEQPRSDNADKVMTRFLPSVAKVGNIVTNTARNGTVPQPRTRKCVRHVQVQTRAITATEAGVQTEESEVEILCVAPVDPSPAPAATEDGNMASATSYSAPSEANESLRLELLAVRKQLEAETRSKAKVAASMDDACKQFDVLSARAYTKIKQILAQRDELAEEVRMLRGRLCELGPVNSVIDSTSPREHRAPQSQAAGGRWI